MSKVTTVSLGWQLVFKVVSESRLGIIWAIFWHWMYISHGLRKLLGNHLYWAWSENASFWWSRLHCCPPTKLSKLKNRIPRESGHHLSNPPIVSQRKTLITAKSSPADICQARQGKAKQSEPHKPAFLSWLLGHFSHKLYTATLANFEVSERIVK